MAAIFLVSCRFFAPSSEIAIVYLSGLDHCVCIAVAVLLACFTVGGDADKSKGGSTGQCIAEYCPPPSKPVAATGNDISSIAAELSACGSVASEADHATPPADPRHMSWPGQQLKPCSSPSDEVNPPGDQRAEGCEASVDVSSHGRGSRAGRLTISPAVSQLEVTKDNVRQRLAYVSSSYPIARPTRGSLKQVFNFFQQHSACCSMAA